MHSTGGATVIHEEGRNTDEKAEAEELLLQIQVQVLILVRLRLRHHLHPILRRKRRGHDAAPAAPATTPAASPPAAATAAAAQSHAAAAASDAARHAHYVAADTLSQPVHLSGNGLPRFWIRFGVRKSGVNESWIRLQRHRKRAERKRVSTNPAGFFDGFRVERRASRRVGSAPAWHVRHNQFWAPARKWSSRIRFVSERSFRIQCGFPGFQRRVRFFSRSAGFDLDPDGGQHCIHGR